MAYRRSPDLTIAVRAGNEPATGPIRVTIAPVRSAALRLGALVSILSLVLLLGLVVWVLVPSEVRRPAVATISFPLPG